MDILPPFITTLLGALPGRLGDPATNLTTDRRVIRRMADAMAFLDQDICLPMTPVPLDIPLENLLELMSALNSGTQQLYDTVPLSREDDPEFEFEESERIIKGVDDNDIKLFIFRPYRSASTSDELPCLVYFHGGGMASIKAYNRVHNFWLKDLAATGLLCINVDFRNIWHGPGEHYPFPAGLNDCCSAVRWIHEHRQELRISKIILQGHSEGANLVLATALVANHIQDGFSDEASDMTPTPNLEDFPDGAIDGVYASCPWISGAYGWEKMLLLRELPSLVECDGYLLSLKCMALNAIAYDPEHRNDDNPLTWPSWATPDELEGLPPMVVTVNELDPLKDEGLLFYRKLLAAGVKAVARMNPGIVQCAELFFRRALGDINRAAVRDIKGFIDSL